MEGSAQRITETDTSISERLNKEENIYAILNTIAQFNWQYDIEDVRYMNSDTECHIIIKLQVGENRMVGVGNSDPSETGNILESAVYSAIRNAMTKMYVMDSREVKHTSEPEQKVVREVIPILKKEDYPEVPQKEQPEPEKETAKPSAVKSVFTSTQIEKMMKFKEEYNIRNDEQLLAHLRTWNPQITSKTQLNSTNIEDFFKYVDDLSQEVF